MLEQFLSANEPSRLNLALKLLSRSSEHVPHLAKEAESTWPKGEPTPNSANKVQSTQLDGMLSRHKVTKIKDSAQKSLKTNGLPLEDATLQEMLWQLFITQQPKFKKDATHPYSMILDDNGTPYALFHGILGKGVYGKVKLAQNLLTKEFIAVKVIVENISEPASAIESESKILEKRKLLLGKQLRGKKHYLFMKLLPGIRVGDFGCYLAESHITLSPRQQKLYLIALLKSQLSLMADNIYHSDLHSGNILIDPLNWEANIVDFGMAQDISISTSKNSFFHSNLHRVLTIYKCAKITVPALLELTHKLTYKETDAVGAVKKAIAKLEAMDLLEEVLPPSADPAPEQPGSEKYHLEDYRLLDLYMKNSIKILPLPDKHIFYNFILPKINFNYKNELPNLIQKIQPLNYYNFLKNDLYFNKNSLNENLLKSEKNKDILLELLEKKLKRAKQS